MLPGGPGDTSKAKRETVVSEGPGGMLSVAGAGPPSGTSAAPSSTSCPSSPAAR
ncbi:hypothetical protein ACW23B_04575 [Streptomyces albidoflavus]